MHISRVVIRNFRNFQELSVNLSQHAVILGENTSGKSNFIHALRIVLDPTLSDDERKLLKSDFNYSCQSNKSAAIEITICMRGIEHVEQQSVLYDCKNPDSLENEVEISYRFAPIVNTKEVGDALPKYDYNFYRRTHKQDELQGLQWETSHRLIRNMGDIRKRILLQAVPALRDIESALESWRRSPLRSLIERRELVEDAEFAKIADSSGTITETFRKIDKIAKLEDSINEKLSDMVRGLYPIDARLGLAPADAGQLSQTIRIYAEGDKWRTVDTTSLGIANIIFLALLSTEMKEREQSESEFSILCVEEPEAHLHPHLQRLVFRDYFRDLAERKQQVIVTTHSPNTAIVKRVTQNGIRV